MRDTLSTIFFGLAAIGVVATAFRVLPSLWETNVLDCITVGACLLLGAAMMAQRALTGQWP